MGDRTAFQVIVHEAHPDDVEAIFVALSEYFDFTRDPQITLGEPLLDPEVLCGCSDELAAVLEIVAPLSSFTIWEDPKYEWLGSLNMLHPEFGTYQAECDANGRAVFTETQLADLVANHTGPDLASSLMKLSGAAWRRAFEASDKAFAGRPITRQKEVA